MKWPRGSRGIDRSMSRGRVQEGESLDAGQPAQVLPPTRAHSRFFAVSLHMLIAERGNFSIELQPETCELDMTTTQAPQFFHHA